MLTRALGKAAPCCCGVASLIMLTRQSDIAAIVGLFLRVGAAVGVFLLLGALILAEAGCVKQWAPLDAVTDRVLASCSPRCAVGTAQHRCLTELRANVSANVDQVPTICSPWNTSISGFTPSNEAPKQEIVKP